MLSTRWQARAPVVGGAGSDRFIVCSLVVVVIVVVADSCHVVLCFGILSALRNDRRQMEKLRGKRRLSDFVYFFTVKGVVGRGQGKNCTAAHWALILNWLSRIINGCTLKLQNLTGESSLLKFHNLQTQSNHSWILSKFQLINPFRSEFLIECSSVRLAHIFFKSCDTWWAILINNNNSIAC